MNNLLVLDFECYDQYISRGLGGGWVYKVKVPTSDFRVLGFSFKYLNIDGGEDYKKIDGNLDLLKSLIFHSDGVILHNAQYDLGCLVSLGIDITNLKVYDTNIISKLYDNRLFDYSLDSLSKRYLTSEYQKKKNALIEIMELNKLGPLSKYSKNISYIDFLGKKQGQTTYRRSMEKWAYNNMDTLEKTDFERFSYYAKQDVVSTSELFKYFTKTEVTLQQAEYWSSFTKRLVKLRLKGIKTDMNVIKKALPEIAKDITKILDEINTAVFKILGTDESTVYVDNKILSSPKQLANLLAKLQYQLPKSDKGNDSTNAKWMEEQNDPFLNKIVMYRTYKKLSNDFLIKILEMQEYTCPEGRIGDYGRVYPSYSMLGAGTGRFSCSGPNIQNIPTRNPKWGKIIRSIFVPDNSNNLWVKADWASQEPRLGIHYAVSMNAEGATAMQQEFLRTKYVDLHTLVANIANIDRRLAKTINLGLAYGMGVQKLSKSLGLSFIQTKILLETYHSSLPYIKPMNEKMKEVLTKRGFVCTLLKRKLRRERYIDEETGEIEYSDYKASNKVMQGSGADLMYEAFRQLDEAGFDIKCTVHDEFDIECKSIKEAIQAQKIMENVCKLQVPLAVEIEYGPSWGELTKLEEVKI